MDFNGLIIYLFSFFDIVFNDKKEPFIKLLSDFFSELSWSKTDLVECEIRLC